MKISIDVITCLSMFLSIMCMNTAAIAADEPNQATDTIAEIDAGLDEVDNDMKELEELLGEVGGAEQPEKKQGPGTWKRKYYFKYVTYESPDTGPLQKSHYVRMGVTKSTAGMYAITPAAENERDIFWVMKIQYNKESYKPAEIHMARIKKNDDPEQAIQKIIAEYLRSVAKDGILREAFIADNSKQLFTGSDKVDPLKEFKIEKLAGPFDNPDDACEPMAVYFSMLGFYPSAAALRNESSELQHRIMWDNPKPDKKVYNIFWYYRH